MSLAVTSCRAVPVRTWTMHLYWMWISLLNRNHSFSAIFSIRLDPFIFHEASMHTCCFLNSSSHFPPHICTRTYTARYAESGFHTGFSGWGGTICASAWHGIQSIPPPEFFFFEIWPDFYNSQFLGVGGWIPVSHPLKLTLHC